MLREKMEIDTDFMAKKEKEEKVMTLSIQRALRARRRSHDSFHTTLHGKQGNRRGKKS